MNHTDYNIKEAEDAAEDVLRRLAKLRNPIHAMLALTIVTDKLLDFRFEYIPFEAALKSFINGVIEEHNGRKGDNASKH